MTQITDQQRQIAIDYKKRISARFMLVEGAKLKQRVIGDNFCVTRKIDGHLQCIFFDAGDTFLLNSQGKERVSNLKCIESCTRQLQMAGVKSAVIAAELYMPNENGRPRCNDVASALADSAKRDLLQIGRASCRERV